MLHRPLTRNERQVMNFLRNTTLGAASLSHYTGQSKDAIHSRLRRLENRGLVRRARIGPRNKILWELTEDGQRKLG